MRPPPSVAAGAPANQKIRELERTREIAHAAADLTESVGRQELLAVKIERLGRDVVSGEDWSLAVPELLAALTNLKTQAAETRQSADRMASRRVLTSSWLRFNEATTDAFDHGNFLRAVAYLRVMAVIRPENAQVEYWLARASARLGDRKEALNALRRAVAKGLKDAEMLEREPDLGIVRGHRAFRQILDGLRQGAK